MNMKDRFRFVRQNMAKTKSRVFMTVLATAMGCAFLIVLASVGFGLQKSVVDNIVGDRLVTDITVYGKEGSEGFNGKLTDEDIAYLRSVGHVKAITNKQYVSQNLSFTVDGAKEFSVGATIAVDFADEFKAGMELSAGQAPAKSDEIIIGYHFRQRFTNPEVNPSAAQEQASGGEQTVKKEIPAASDWIGKTVSITIQKEGGASKQQSLTIVGVKAPPSREWKHDSDVYIGQDLLSQIEAYTGTLYGELPVPIRGDDGQKTADMTVPQPLTEKRGYSDVIVVADHVKNVKAISQEIRSQSYMNHSIANELEQVNLLFAIMKIGLIFVGTIAVLIASIGIYNTMTMAVTERTQDIGIMKAIGAHPRSIRAIFIMECAFIGLMGAVIGAIVSYGISFAANAALPLVIEGFMDEKMPEGFLFSRIPAYLTALSTAISLGVAILSGYRPAVRATRVDVLKALRRDV
jgi:acetoin utilization transport system permease protein